MAQTLQNGTILQDGKYKIVSFLGQGGFGITYLAENTMLDKKVAIKEFFPKDFCDRQDTSQLRVGTESNMETVEKLKERFLKEARNIAKIDFPGIVKIFDIFKENNTSYYVMEYIEGENLNDIVKKNGPLSEDKAIEYIKGVGEALEHIHSKNMTHFDVKPSNIVIRKSNDKPILIDFGLSKQYNKDGEATSTLLQGVSKGYSPIELYNADENLTFSPQTDIYSLAATLYYVLQNKIPQNALELLQRDLDFPIHITSRLYQTIKIGMSPQYKDRFENINSFIISLNGLSNNNDKTIIIESDFKDTDANSDSISAIKNRAGKGEIQSQIKLADLYYKGSIIPQDYEKAFDLFLKAAGKGNLYAMKMVGNMYKEGDGTQQNFEEAITWLEKASLLGDKASMKILALMYTEGQGVNKNLEEANKWLTKLYDLEDIEGIKFMGDFYYEEKDYDRAFELYDKLIDSKVNYNLQNLSVRATLIANELYSIPQKNEEIENKYIYWYKKAAIYMHEWNKKNIQNINLNPFYNIINIYNYQEFFNKKNKNKLFEFIKKYAEKGNPVFLDTMGDIYYLGKTVPKNLEETKKYWQLAQKNGFSSSSSKINNQIFRYWDLKVGGVVKSILFLLIGGILIASILMFILFYRP